MLLWRTPKFSNKLRPQALQQLRSMPIRFLDVNCFELDSLCDFEALANQLELMPNTGLLLSYSETADRRFYLHELQLGFISKYISFVDSRALVSKIFWKEVHDYCRAF